MELNKLTKTIEKGHKRLGRGLGSGRGKTSGRGMKGQKARGNIKLFFEGGALPLTKRMPFLRGRGRNSSLKSEKISINVGLLDQFPSKSQIDTAYLIKKGVVSDKATKAGVKILGMGELKTALTVKLPVSAGARKKIEKAGGSVVAN